MPHCAPGNRFVTAAAIRCAVLWRSSGSASGLLSVTMRTAESCSSGYERSTSLPLTIAAYAAVAAEISPGLAKAAYAAIVNGKLVDLSYPLEQDSAVRIVTDKNAEALPLLRHSTAHLMA